MIFALSSGTGSDGPDFSTLDMMYVPLRVFLLPRALTSSNRISPHQIGLIQLGGR